MNHSDILLVEDNKYHAELTLRALKKMELEEKISWVKDGEQAINFVRAQIDSSVENEKAKLRVVLLDLSLPKINGIEVLKFIRSTASTKDIPVIIITTSTSEEEQKQCNQLGIAGFLLKPPRIEELVELFKKFEI